MPVKKSLKSPRKSAKKSQKRSHKQRASKKSARKTLALRSIRAESARKIMSGGEGITTIKYNIVHEWKNEKISIKIEKYGDSTYEVCVSTPSGKSFTHKIDSTSTNDIAFDRKSIDEIFLNPRDYTAEAKMNNDKISDLQFWKKDKSGQSVQSINFFKGDGNQKIDTTLKPKFV